MRLVLRSSFLEVEWELDLHLLGAIDRGVHTDHAAIAEGFELQHVKTPVDLFGMSCRNPQYAEPLVTLHRPAGEGNRGGIG